MKLSVVNGDTGEVVDFVMPAVRTRFNYNRDAYSAFTGSLNDQPSKTQQQFREETDINYIVKQFGLTGRLPNNVRVPQYGDFEGVMDYQTAMNAVIAAREQFMELPAEVRARFANDPQMLLAFMADEKNYEEAVKLGLAHKRPEVAAPPPPAPPPGDKTNSST